MNVYSPVVQCSLSIKIILRLLFILYETYIFLTDFFCLLDQSITKRNFLKKNLTMLVK